MVKFLKPAAPAVELADALWKEVRDGDATRQLAGTASEERSQFEAAFDEIVYFRGFATDLTIHRVFQRPSVGESVLRELFLQRLRDYAISRRCTPCPVGEWQAENTIWHVQWPGRDTGNPLQHLSERFELYAGATRRPAERSLPVVTVLCGLCDTRGTSFVLPATSAFIDYSIHTQELLRKARVTPRKT